MSDKEVHVYIDLDGATQYVGQLWVHERKGRESASFQYEKSWLNNPARFAIEPALMLSAGTFHTPIEHVNFGAIGDSAPDRWGRMLIRRTAAQHAQSTKQPLHTLNEIDYLLAVNDEARQGALRFSMEKDASFLAQYKTSAIPPLLHLSKLLTATEHVIDDEASDAELRLLLAPGASLGGARPKASVRDQNGLLAIAKFPSTHDEYSIVLWEAVALTLANLANIKVPTWKIIEVANKPVIIINRFDRIGTNRIPYISAMSMLGAKDNEQHSYLEIVDAIKQYGAKPKQYIRELWRRIIFSILISNTDDHLRNHGMLYTKHLGWTLSPVFDVNPTPIDIKARVLTTSIDMDNNTSSLELAFSVIHEFDLNLPEAKEIVDQVTQAVSHWRNVAKDLGIKSSEITRMSSAFEH